MRRWMVILFFILIFCGCQSKNELELIVEDMTNQTYSSASQYANCDLELTKLTKDTIRYRVVINQPQTNLDNVRAIVLCEDRIGETVPSFGFYENDKCCLYIDKIDIGNNYYEGISLMGLTVEKNVRCYVYLSYETNGELIEEYILLEECLDDAS